MYDIISSQSHSQPIVWTEDQIDLIKRTIAKDADDDELKVFLYHCATSGLDPLKKHIFFQKYQSRHGKPNCVYITSIDGFRLIAARTSEHAGTDDAIFDDEKKPTKASVTVYRMIKGVRCPYTATARMSEYKPAPPKDHMWNKMPCTMLAKCAEALALRKAFPNELSGFYSKEEMDQADEVKPEPQKEVKKHPVNITPKQEILNWPYKIQFGKLIGKLPSECSTDELASELERVREALKARGTEPSKPVAEFIDKVCAELTIRVSQPIDPQEIVINHQEVSNEPTKEGTLFETNII